METDWAENRAQLKDIGLVRGLLSRFLDQVFTTSERDKFRTRFERGTEPGTTEIYVSHRGMEEVITGSLSSDVPDTRWQPRPPDPNLEAEMLGRLMTRFGVEQTRIKAQFASAGSTLQQRATLLKGADGTRTLTLDEQFDSTSTSRFSLHSGLSTQTRTISASSAPEARSVCSWAPSP